LDKLEDEMIPTLEWTPEGVNFLDQTKLPHEETYVLAKNYTEVARAIKDMIVRGAMAIGVSAAMGVALGIERSNAKTIDELNKEVDVICEMLAKTRPTAVNLFWGIAQVRDLYVELAAKKTPIPEIKREVVALAKRLYDEDIANLRRLGAFGAELLPHEGTVLTHCNAGALAACGYGSALGVIRAAVEAGKKIDVYADETRPFNQGTRLTAWELLKDNIPTTLICDNMAAYCGCGPYRLERRYRQQDRHLWCRHSREGARHSVLRSRSVQHHRPRNRERRGNSNRAARCPRSNSRPWSQGYASRCRH
jgi:methylthioribose-1-phosphate isomerase